MFFVFCEEELALSLLANIFEDVNFCGKTYDRNLYFHLNDFVYRLKDIGIVTIRKTRKHYENLFSPVVWESFEIGTCTFQRDLQRRLSFDLVKFVYVGFL